MSISRLRPYFIAFGVFVYLMIWLFVPLSEDQRIVVDIIYITYLLIGIVDVLLFCMRTQVHVDRCDRGFLLLGKAYEHIDDTNPDTYLYYINRAHTLMDANSYTN